MRTGLLLPVLILCLSSPATAEPAPHTEPVVGIVPVYEGDVSRPYRVVGEVKANLRKRFAFAPDPNREAAYVEIWERAQKMGADAVIHARFGPTRSTFFNYGKTPISGTAIQFVDRADQKP